MPLLAPLVFTLASGAATSPRCDDAWIMVTTMSNLECVWFSDQLLT